MIKNDRWIIEMGKKGMIAPFETAQVRKGVISFGASSYGYDLRIFHDFRIPIPQTGTIIDPKNFDEGNFEHYTGDVCEIPAHSYIICRSLEYFRIPRDVLVICFGKSTYARCGIVVNITPLEPEWEGYITISVSNTSPLPVRLYANEGLAQLIFLAAEEECLTSYADKKGKYQAQKDIVLPKV